MTFWKTNQKLKVLIRCKLKESIDYSVQANATNSLLASTIEDCLLKLLILKDQRIFTSFLVDQRRKLKKRRIVDLKILKRENTMRILQYSHLFHIKLRCLDLKFLSVQKELKVKRISYLLNQFSTLRYKIFE